MSTNSRISIQFERRDISSRQVKLLAVAENMIAKIRNINMSYRVSFQDAISALKELSDEFVNPSYDAHPNDLFTFSYNGNSFSLTWEPACYTTEMGII